LSISLKGYHLVLEQFHQGLIVVLHYNNECFSSFLVSLDFKWIWTFLPSEIIEPPIERGPIVTDNELFH
jgi:hypothetical protein